MALKALFKYTSISQQALRSFDDYTTNKIPQIINSTVRVTSQLEDDGHIHEIRIHSPKWGEPCIIERDGEVRILTSTEAKLRDLTYSTPLYGQITYKILTSEGTVKSQKKYNDVFLARIPVMVKSSLDTTNNLPSNQECEYDPGGYFCINGREKTSVIQENIKPNTVMVFESKSRGIESVIYPRIDSLTMTNATIKVYNKRDYIFIDINGQKPFCKPVVIKRAPVVHMIHVLGKTHEDLKQCLVENLNDDDDKTRALHFIDPSFDSVVKYKTTMKPMHGRDKKAVAAYTIQRAWFHYATRNPRVNSRLVMYSYHKKWETMIYPHDPDNAGEILLEQIKLLVYTSLKFREPDSRDAEKNKRLAAAGTLMASLTAQLWNQWIEQLTKTIQKYVNSRKQLRLNKLCKDTFLTDGLKYR